MAENIDKAKENSLQTANCEKDNCAHYIDKQYAKFYKSKFLLILAGFSFAVVALFIFVTYSYNKSQGDIVNNYREYKHEIDSIHRTVQKDSTFSLKQQGILDRMEYQQNSIQHQLEMQSVKLSSDFTLLSLWAGVLMLVFLIFSIYSVFKTDELMKQSRADIDKIEENSDKANQLLVSVQKKVDDALKEINKAAKTESDELKKNTAETIGQIKEEVGKAIAEKSSEFNDKCNDYLSQLEKIKDAFSVIQKLFSKNVDENPDSGDGQETR